ncbi:MAG: AsmA family protein, partial [Gammaproteobacteria bacterium]
MRRTIKYFFIFLALVLLALLAFVATFDANNYKPQIIEQVEQATGRDFTIEGDINLSIFPWIGLKVENVTLGNEKGFIAKQFAAIKQLDVKVNVLPLLKKQVEINVIRLHGLDVSLEVAKDKSNNWSSLSQAEADADKTKAPDETDTAQTEQTVDEEKGPSPLASLKVEGFEFVDAVIRYDDRSSNTSATVSELNLTTTAITFDQPVELEFGARIENNQPAIDTRLKLTTQLVFNQDFTEFKLRDLVFTILAKANEFIKQDEEVEIKSDVDVLMDEQRITLKQLQISALGTNTNVEITVSQFLETPMIQGSIEIQAFDARKVARRVGVELPEMAKADALSRVAIKTKLKLQGEKLQANEFNLKLDDSTLSGWLHVTDISKQQLRYDLAFDQLNLNDYLPPAVDTPADTVAGGGATTADAASGNEKIELPVEIMRELDIQGDFRIASLTAKEYDIKQFLMSLKAQNGVIVIKPLSLQVLEGQVLSAVNINVQKTVPAYAIGLDVNRVQIGPVVNPFLEGVMGDEPLKMQGAVNLKMDVATAGESANQLKKASKGQIVLDMKETAVDGFDPEFYMRKSIADYVNEKGFGLSKTIMGSYKPR